MSENQPSGIPASSSAAAGPSGEVMRRIQDCRTHRRTYLILAFFYMRRFPAELFDMIWLRELDLDVNLISTIPPEIGKLIHLRA
jgi:Leucine-rich repeat (LRR) protein